MSNPFMHHRWSAENHERAAHDARYYTSAQLELFNRHATLGFKFAMVASWLLVSFFVAQFFAGAEFETLDNWRVMQFIYAGMGILLATALTYAEVFLFNSGKTREVWLVALLSIS